MLFAMYHSKSEEKRSKKLNVQTNKKLSILQEANWECSVLFMINLMHKSWKQIVSVLYREHNQVQAQGPPCSWSFLLATAAMVTSSDAELPSSAERHGRTRECGRPSGVAVGGGTTRLSLIRVCELGRGVDVASSDRSPSPRTPPACLNSGVAPLPGATGCSSRCCTPRSRTNPPGALRRRAGSGGATRAGSFPRRGERRGRQRLRGSDGRQGRRRLWGYGRLITETRFVFESARFETI